MLLPRSGAGGGWGRTHSLPPSLPKKTSAELSFGILLKETRALAPRFCS